MSERDDVMAAINETVDGLHAAGIVDDQAHREFEDLSRQEEHVRFDRQVVLVTGAGRGLGRAYAMLFAQRGAHVIVHDAGVDADGVGADTSVADAVVTEIAAAGGTATPAYDDLSHAAGCEALVARVVASTTRLDALVSNAGIVRPTSLADTDTDLWDSVRRINLDASLWLGRAVMPVMQRQGYGRIVLTMTGHGRDVDPATTDLIAYSTSKWGLFGLMNSLAGIGLPHGVLVNAISPVAATRIFRATVERGTLMPEQVAPVVALLASPAWTGTGCVVGSADERVSTGQFTISRRIDFGRAPVRPEDIAARLPAETKD